MDENTHRKVFAVIVCFFLLIFYKQSIWDPFFHPTIHGANRPIDDAGLENGKPSTSSTLDADNTNPSGKKATSDVLTLEYPSDAQLQASGTILIDTADQQVELSLLGGRARHLRLKQYKEHNTAESPVFDLVQHADLLPLPFGAYSAGQSDAHVQYRLLTVEGADRSDENGTQIIRVLPGSEAKVILEGQWSAGQSIRKTLVFQPAGYVIDLKAEISRSTTENAPLELEWTRFIADTSSSLTDPYNISEFVWYDSAKAHREHLSAIEVAEQAVGNVKWLSLGDTYFLTSLVSPSGLTPGRVLKTAQLYRTRLSGSGSEVQAKVVAGPKSYPLLRSLGDELRLNVAFGWTGFVAAPLSKVLHFFFGIFANYGLSIIALTILVKALLYPLNSAAFNQMKKMQDLAPEIRRIQESSLDKQQKNLELMALHKKHNVNPLGGCLPMLVQIPIFFGLYSSLVAAIELRHAPFALWVKDLSAPEALMIGGIGIPLLVILYVVALLVQQWTTPSTMDPTQKKIMLIMPFAFGFMFLQFPAGLTLYFLTNALLGIAQQQAIRKMDGAAAMRFTGYVSLGIFGFAYLLTKL